MTAPSGEEIAAALHALAAEFANGMRPVRARGQGARRVGNAVVVPLAIHDVLCGWQVATLQEDADVLHCAGCGLCYSRADVRGAL